MSIIIKAQNYAKEKYYMNPQGHNWEHIQKVWDRAIEIAQLLDDEDKDVDVEILNLAVIFHDIVYNDPKTHCKNSADEAEKFLKNMGYPDSKIKKIKEIIMCHSIDYIERNGTPKLLEAKILFDADKSVLILDKDKYKKFEKAIFFDITRKLIEKNIYPS